MPTLNASTRRLGSDTLTPPVPSWSLTRSATTPSMPGEVGARQRRERDLVVAGAAQALAHHRAHLLLGPLAHRAGDHARLAEAAARACSRGRSRRSAGRARPRRAARAAASGTASRPRSATVRLSTTAGTSAKRGVHRADERAVVLDVVHRRARTRRRSSRARAARLRATRARRASTRRSTSAISPMTSSPSPMTNASTYSASGSGLYAQCPPAITIGCSGARSSLRTGTPARSTQFSRFV